MSSLFMLCLVPVGTVIGQGHAIDSHYGGRLIITVCPDGTGDYTTIQDAINASTTGDIIELCDGLYFGSGNWDLSFLGKEITVRSQSGDPAACVVDCVDSERGFSFEFGEGPDAVLENITITRGNAYQQGGGVWVVNSNPTLRNIIFRDNTATEGGTTRGGGLYVFHSSTTDTVKVSNCQFYDNTAYVGGAVSCTGGTIVLNHCTFATNVAGADGGALRCEGPTATVVMTSCTIDACGADILGSAIQADNFAMVHVYNTIITNCLGPKVLDASHDAGINIASCNNLWGNQNGDYPPPWDSRLGIAGNISEDPMYCDGLNSDEPYTLQCHSPCAPFNPPNDECDLIGAWPVGCWPCFVTVSSPNGGEEYSGGEPMQILWAADPCCGDLVAIELLLNGEICTLIDPATENDGLYIWPAEQCNGSQDGYTLRVTALDSGEFDESDAEFRIISSYEITQVEDVGNDQGRRVRVRWNRCWYDEENSGITIVSYSIWRRVDQYLRQDHGDEEIDGLGGKSYPPGQWDFVLEIPAGGEDEYGTVCETLCDSTEYETCWSVFFVRAHTPEPLTYYDTDPDSGYSVDNLAPGVPQNFFWEYPATLHWDESEAEDFDYFTVYASESPVFDENAIEVGRTIERSLDISTSADIFAYYYLTSSDFAGNEGDPAIVQTPSSTPGTSASALAFRLWPAHPNPCAGKTVLLFDLPQAERVKMTIYDPKGRIVRRLMDSPQCAGSHRISWDLLTEDSKKVGTGIYFVQMRAGQQSVTERITVVR